MSNTSCPFIEVSPSTHQQPLSLPETKGTRCSRIHNLCYLYLPRVTGSGLCLQELLWRSQEIFAEIRVAGKASAQLYLVEELEYHLREAPFRPHTDARQSPMRGTTCKLRGDIC